MYTLVSSAIRISVEVRIGFLSHPMDSMLMQLECVLATDMLAVEIQSRAVRVVRRFVSMCRHNQTVCFFHKLQVRIVDTSR